jgi:hypothetical protein
LSDDEQRARVQRVIDLIFKGGGLSAALEEIQMDHKTFCQVLDNTPSLSQSYGRARQFKADLMADDIVVIADTEQDPIKGRNRIDARRWLASKLKPSEYADRLDVNLNQTIDIGQALTDARNRALPPSDLNQVQLPQTLDSTKLPQVNAAGLEPVSDVEGEWIDLKSMAEPID